jgi:hypothetical protein
MLLIGFTGTRDSIRILIKNLARQHVSVQGVHGGAEGADRQFHRLLKELNIPSECYPSNEEQWRWSVQNCVVCHAMQAPLTRNRVIVEVSNLMFATPRTFIEKQRSGTWATIRYAKKTNNPLTVIWPDGSTTEYFDERKA